MALIIIILLGISAVAICIQDFSRKWIHIGWILAWGISAVTFSFLNGYHWSTILVNVAFLLVVFMALQLYLYLKFKRYERILNRYLGTGDVLIFLFLCPGYNLYNYVLFLLIACLGGCVYWIVKSTIGRGYLIRIPLAGIMVTLHFIFVLAGRAFSIDFITKTLILDQ